MWDLGKEHWRGRGQTFQSHEVIFWHFFFFFLRTWNTHSILSPQKAFRICFLYWTWLLHQKSGEKKIWFRIYFESWAKSQLGCIWSVREREKLRITCGFSVLATGWMAPSFTGYWHEVGRFLLSLRCFLNPNRDAERAASIGVWVH